MVSDQEIASCVESLLRQSDPATAAGANLSTVVRQVEAKLGLDLSHKAGFIRDLIELLLGPHRPPLPSPPNQHRHLLHPLQQGDPPPVIPLEATKAAEPDSKKSKTEDVAGATQPDAGQYPVVISDGLAKFFGSEEKEMPETEAFRRVWDYIKANQLEDSENALILCDPKLQELFGCVSLPTSRLSDMLAGHLVKRS